MSNDPLHARYARQLLLPELGEEGQEKLRAARVLIVGVGGLGSPAAYYLAAAGVGTLGLIDADVVSLHNLQRQILYTEAEVGQPKVVCAAKRLQQLNTSVQLHTYPTYLDATNAEHIVQAYDVVVDGCDNFATRYLLNDTCRALSIPYVYGAIQHFEGQVSVFHYKNHADYLDLYPDREQMERIVAHKGVIGVTPGVVGTVEASEALKVIADYGEVADGVLWTIDLLTLDTHRIRFK